MESSEIVARIHQVLPEAEVSVEGADCSFTTVVVSSGFEGMLPVKRQQTILAQFAELLAKGDLHALSVQAYTPAEWQARQATGLTQLTL